MRDHSTMFGTCSIKLSKACVSGSWDYLVKLMTRNAAEHDALHAKLLAMPMVSRVRGMPVIGKTHVKPLPLDHEGDGGLKR